MSKRALLAMPVAGLGLLALAACSPSTPDAAPSTPATTTATVLTTTASSATSAPAPTTTTPTKASATPVTGANTACKVNPANHPVPTADPVAWVPEADRVQVSLSGVPSGTVKVTGAPVEVDLTVCNDSPVAYPQVGFVLALDHCSCAGEPIYMAKGTVQRYDAATGAWVATDHSSVGGGMDYLTVFTGQQPLPKGKAVTVRYRFSYDPSMTSGKGGVIGAVVTPDGPHVLGQTSLSYTVTH
ncbi:hypothetical protein ACFFS4_04470 [Kutzneria kofuensis]|uniref:Plastocyanin n=1 Tax=Kutzneria kofuensis TaxID=103725 RepID=A0A7W9KL26_9PSEU|nr:hypothetical protein [Kutzneria kofuensis]MBB5894432.1 plastocyanin [Kutzneria kofuensis]